MVEHEPIMCPSPEEQPVCEGTVPERLQKLMLRLASLRQGHAYGITLYLPESGEPFWAIVSQGKLENRR